MRRPRPAILAILSVLSFSAIQPVSAKVVADFRDLTLPDGIDVWNGSDGGGMFRTRGVLFSNSYDADWSFWSGFAYSRVNDRDTPGWGNQYAVISGTGVGETGIYAVAYTGHNDAVITLPVSSKVRGIHVNNTTYAALDIENGSLFSKKFGGESGDDPDWFKLTVTGYEADGYPSGSASIYLADYRFGNNDQNYILRDWTWLSLTNLGEYVETLHFELSSSDTGEWGMNTPAYFALGSLEIDEHYSPAAGQEGSKAVWMQSESIIGWAAGWTNYVPGANIDEYWKNPASALGPPSGTITNIVCLGDGGGITMIFDPPIQDGPGPDFAIFENAFDDFFLELAYVEVSSDGVNFSRFFNRSLTAEPVPFAGATVWATNVHGLAGKYRGGYGTPFDLGDLAGTPDLDPDNVRYVRLIDITGNGTAIDSAGHAIFDPYPTAGSPGFDLDAVTVLSNATAEISLQVIRSATDKRGLSNAVIAVQRKAWTIDTPLEAHLQISGSGISGVDYTSIAESIIFGPGETERLIEIQPLPESAGRGDRDVVIRLQSDDAYLNGRRDRVRVMLLDVCPFDVWQLMQLRADFNTLPLEAENEYWNGSDLSGGFTVNGIHFSNHYDTDWHSWQGFAYSCVNNTEIGAYGNQYAVISGTGVGGSGNYVIAYDAGQWGHRGTITIPAASGILGFYVNNTTWAALDMETGSIFSKRFGGEDGTDPDWFRLTVFGHAADGSITGSKTIYLADYRSGDTNLNYILRDWTWLCLTNLGMQVQRMTYELESSDTGDWGMNTPAYFALDGLVIDPSSPSAMAAADWSNDGTGNLMAYTLGRRLGDHHPGAPMNARGITNGFGTRGLAIEFDRRRNLNGIWLQAEVCKDLKQGVWISGAEHVQETVIGGDTTTDRIRATPTSTNTPLFMRLRATR